MESRVVPARSWTTRAVLPDEPVEQRRLADVRPPDDGDARRARLVRRPRCVLDLGASASPSTSAPSSARPLGGGNSDDHDVEQVAGAPAVQGADRVRLAEPEGEELPALVLAAVVVGLVGDDDDLVVAAAQPAGDDLVVVGHPDGAVDDEQHDVGVAHGGLDLAADLGLEVGAAGHPAAGVDDAERHAEPLGLERLAVAGDARAVLDDGRLLADDAVEQRRLADVGPADDGTTGGQGGHARSRARRRAWPSVATTSTGRGRSSTVPPSRKRPSSDRQTSGSR